MHSLTGRLAALFTAVGVATLASPLAVAQENTVTLEGLVWFDRDADGVVDAGEPPKSYGWGVRVFNATTDEFIGEYGTGADGRYRAEVPDVPLAIHSHNAERFESTTKATFSPVSGGGTFDFGVRGGTVQGFDFVDANRDGVKQSDEEQVPGDQAVSLFFYSGGLEGPGTIVPQPTRGPDGGFAYQDLPFGDYKLVAADKSPRFMIAPPLPGGHDVDPVTRERAVRVPSVDPVRADARYARPNGDFEVGEPRLEPAREAYRVGDVVTLTVTVTNRGETPDKPSFVVFGSTPEFLSANDALEVVTPGQDFRTRDALAVGAKVDVRLEYRLTDPEFDEFHLFARPISAFGIKDVDVRNNHAVVPLEYLADEPTTSTTPAPETTTAPTSTTTADAAVQVANGGSGLADTGATPLPWAAIGGLLLGAGALTFLAARRRRRA